MSDLIESHHTTHDFNLAAFLWCIPGVTMSDVSSAPGIGGNNRRRVSFTFKLPLSGDDLDGAINEYLNNRSSVEPRQFADNQVKLRQIIHTQM